MTPNLGCGKVLQYYFENRTYNFVFPTERPDSECRLLVRGHMHNAGVPAGTILGVCGFKQFMESCPEIATEVHGVVFGSLYADDWSPLGKASS